MNIRKKNVRKQHLIHLLLIAVTCLLWSCNTRIEGCLDAEADNFDFDAELACNDCCEYPSVLLTLSQKWLDNNFTNADTLLDAQGRPYQIKDLKYFLTTWSWQDDQGVHYTVDSARGDCGDVDLVYTPDILVIDTRQFNYTLGKVRKSPVTNKLLYHLALTEDYSCLDSDDPSTPDQVTTQSPLWNPETGSLASLRLILQQDLTDSLPPDTLFLDISSAFTFPYVLEFVKGNNNAFELTVDYGLWFSEVNIDDLSSFEQSIQQHIAGSFYPTP